MMAAAREEARVEAPRAAAATAVAGLVEEVWVAATVAAGKEEEVGAEEREVATAVVARVEVVRGGAAVAMAVLSCTRTPLPGSSS